MVLCGSKYTYQNGMCLKGIGLHAQNLLTTLGLIVNIIEGAYINAKNKLHFDNE